MTQTFLKKIKNKVKNQIIKKSKHCETRPSARNCLVDDLYPDNHTDLGVTSTMGKGLHLLCVYVCVQHTEYQTVS